MNAKKVKFREQGFYVSDVSLFPLLSLPAFPLNPTPSTDRVISSPGCSGLRVFPGHGTFHTRMEKVPGKQPTHRHTHTEKELQLVSSAFC